MQKAYSNTYMRGWCVLMVLIVSSIASVYIFNFEFVSRLSPIYELFKPNDNFVSNLSDDNIQKSFNTTSHRVSTNPLNTNFHPLFRINGKDLINKRTSITAKGTFSIKNQSLFSLLQNETTQTPLVRRRFICYVPQGRIGNHLFQYASIYGIATLNNMLIMTAEICEICHYFRVQNVLIINNIDVCSKFKLYSEIMPRVFAPELLKLPKNINVSIRGYLQSWKYFQNVTDSLLEQLKFKESIETISRRELDNLKLKFVSDNRSILTVIGIHIRIGDLYNDPKNHKIGLDPAPASYINKAIQYYMAKYKKIIFIVCSDTIHQAKEIINSFNLNVNIYYMEGKRKPIDDLAILAKCDHVIQTVGTFGWWAAYLAGGTSVYYNYPGRPGSQTEKRLNSYDFFYPKWIGMDADEK